MTSALMGRAVRDIQKDRRADANSRRNRLRFLGFRWMTSLWSARDFYVLALSIYEGGHQNVCTISGEKYAQAKDRRAAANSRRNRLRFLGFRWMTSSAFTSSISLRATVSFPAAT